MAAESDVPTGPIFATRLAYKYQPKPTFAVEYGPTRDCDSSELRTFHVRPCAPTLPPPTAPQLAVAPSHPRSAATTPVPLARASFGDRIVGARMWWLHVRVLNAACPQAVVSPVTRDTDPERVYGELTTTYGEVFNEHTVSLDQVRRGAAVAQRAGRE